MFSPNLINLKYMNFVDKNISLIFILMQKFVNCNYSVQATWPNEIFRTKHCLACARNQCVAFGFISQQKVEVHIH